jgi:hypothetical protein
MDPPAPPAAVPLRSVSQPELPDAVVPLLSVSAPLVPLETALADEMTTDPVEALVLPPDVIATPPPVVLAADAAPPYRLTMFPFPASDTPTLNTMAPPRPLDALPEVI